MGRLQNGLLETPVLPGLQQQAWMLAALFCCDKPSSPAVFSDPSFSINNIRRFHIRTGFVDFCINAISPPASSTVMTSTTFKTIITAKISTTNDFCESLAIDIFIGIKAKFCGLNRLGPKTMWAAQYRQLLQEFPIAHFYIGWRTDRHNQNTRR